MAYWDQVYEVIREIDDNNLQIYVDTYNLPDDEGVILVFDNNNSVDEFGKLLKTKLENIPEVKQDLEDERYDISDRWEWWIEEAVGGYEFWTYSDEGFCCSECNTWHFYYERNACSYANYKVGDGYIICDDCIKINEEYRNWYIEDLINNPHNANTILEYKDLINLDFNKINDDPYANGWYHRMDDPEKILEIAKAKYPNNEFIFSIRKTYNPFETEFDLYMRETA